MAVQVRRRRPQDATLRNIRALKKRVLHLEQMIRVLQHEVSLLKRRAR